MTAQTAWAQGYDISQCTLSGVYKVKSIMYASEWLQFPVVTAPDGTVLEQGTDYKLIATLPHETVLDVTNETSGYFFLKDPLYDEMVNNRMYVTLTVEGIGSHSGTQSFTYRLFYLMNENSARFDYKDYCFIRDTAEYNLVAQAWNEGQEFYKKTLIIDGDMTFDPNNLTIDNDGDTVTGGTIVSGDYGYHFEQIYWHYIVPGRELWPEVFHYHLTHDASNTHPNHIAITPVISQTLAIDPDATQGQGVSITPNNLWGTLDGCDGSEEHPYVIRTPEGLEQLATVVNNIPAEALYYSGNAFENASFPNPDDPANLIEIRYDADFSGIDYFHFQLGNDIAYDPDVLTIDLDGNGTLESNHTPIGKYWSSAKYDSYHFSGYFDGCGHTISGIRINLNPSDYKETLTFIELGVFGVIGEYVSGDIRVGGTITGITLTDTRITGNQYSEVGGIVSNIQGDNNSTISTVSNCYVKSGVYLNNSLDVGGIVAFNSDGNITNCHVMDDVHIQVDYYGEQIVNIGGITGYCQGSTVSNCTSAAQFTFGNDVTSLWWTGGIVGYNYGTVSNCLALGINIPSVTTTQGIGAIVGRNYGTHYGTLDHNYYVNCTVGGETANIGYGCQDGSTWLTSDLTENDGAVPGLALYDSGTDASGNATTIADNADTDKNVALYGRTLFKDGDKSTLYLGSANTLRYPKTAVTLGSCRAYFTVNDGSEVKDFVLSFGGSDNATGLSEYSEYSENSEAWYSLDGRKLQGKPTQKGIYIHKGRKMLK